MFDNERKLTQEPEVAEKSPEVGLVPPPEEPAAEVPEEIEPTEVPEAPEAEAMEALVDQTVDPPEAKPTEPLQPVEEVVEAPAEQMPEPPTEVRLPELPAQKKRNQQANCPRRERRRSPHQAHSI